MKLYCGIDLHSNNHWLTLINEHDERLVEERLAKDLAVTLEFLAPYRESLEAIAVESTFNCGYIYPRRQRADRDLLRHRCRLVRQRTKNVLAAKSRCARELNMKVSSAVMIGTKQQPWPAEPLSG